MRGSQVRILYGPPDVKAAFVSRSIRIVATMDLTPTEEARAQLLNTYIQNHFPNSGWTLASSRQNVLISRTSGEVRTTFFYSDHVVPITLTGETILVDGKDITGTLGNNTINNTTYGDQSPIVGTLNVSAAPTTTVPAQGFSLLHEIILPVVVVLVAAFIGWLIALMIKHAFHSNPSSTASPSDPS